MASKVRKSIWRCRSRNELRLGAVLVAVPVVVVVVNMAEAARLCFVIAQIWCQIGANGYKCMQTFA